ncbi:NADH-ubiquinone oxidoreductase chain 3 [Nymphaea thermarum]|nr:NADH-ubiquinone oxidoreductase chain 3 [Nymphaea thermarum]
MSEFAHICIYLVISLLVSLIPLNVPFPFASNSSTYPEKLSAHECGFAASSDARIPPNKIVLFGFSSTMTFLLILTIGFLHEWKTGASDWE